MKLLKLIQKKVRVLKKQHILKKCIEQSGGDGSRKGSRDERLFRIRENKKKRNSIISYELEDKRNKTTH